MFDSSRADRAVLQRSSMDASRNRKRDGVSPLGDLTDPRAHSQPAPAPFRVDQFTATRLLVLANFTCKSAFFDSIGNSRPSHPRVHCSFTRAGCSPASAPRPDCAPPAPRPGTAMHAICRSSCRWSRRSPTLAILLGLRNFIALRTVEQRHICPRSKIDGGFRRWWSDTRTPGEPRRDHLGRNGSWQPESDPTFC